MSVNEVICIIGMHRSGTSMVARLLNVCGLHLGSSEQLLGPDTANTQGYFEHGGFHKIDEALLAHFGGSWDDPPDFKPGWEHETSLAGLVNEAKAIVDEFSGFSPWGWKEPRTTLLLPFWQAIIPNLRYVICVRSPLEVARSLAKRDGISIAAGAHIWNRYMRDAIRYTEGWPAILTFYDDYFRDGIPETNRLVEFCGLPKQNSPSCIEDVITTDLRHHSNEILELMNEPNIATEYKLLYIGLRSLSREFVLVGSKQGISESTSRLLRLFEEWHETGKAAALEVRVVEKEQQLSRLHILLREQDQQIERLQIFSAAVRRTLVYRFYRKFVKPFLKYDSSLT